MFDDTSLLTEDVFVFSFVKGNSRPYLGILTGYRENDEWYVIAYLDFLPQWVQNLIWINFQQIDIWFLWVCEINFISLLQHSLNIKSLQEQIFNENLQWFIAEKYLFSKFLFVLKVIVKQIYSFIQTDHKNLTHIFVVNISCKILNKLNLLNLLLFPKTIKSWSNYSIYENAHFDLIFKHFSESIAYNDVLAMN